MEKPRFTAFAVLVLNNAEWISLKPSVALVLLRSMSVNPRSENSEGALNLNKETSKEALTPFMAAMCATFADAGWVRENEGKIKNLFPETLTHIANINMLKVRYGLKLIGLDYRDESQFTQIMVLLEELKFILREGYSIRRNPNSVFDQLKK